MKLHYRKLGSGRPLVVLHGVFGSSDNLFSVCRTIAETGYEVYILDARNHGKSERSEEFNYEAMARDLDDFLAEHQVRRPVILGHSMGGKTVLHYSQQYTNFSGLVVVDITARGYAPHHDHIIQGLQAIATDTLTSRKEAEEIFSRFVTDPAERQFLLKNLYRTEGGGFDWRINIPVLAENQAEVVAEIPLYTKVEQPLLVLRGAESDYVRDEDVEALREFYPGARLQTVAGAGHWVHAAKPAAFVQAVTDFMASLPPVEEGE